MRVTVDSVAGPRSVLKGAPEVLLDRCHLEPAQRDVWLARAEAAASDGYRVLALAQGTGAAESDLQLDRKSVGEGKSVSVRVALGGRRIIKKSNPQTDQITTIPTMKHTFIT